MLDSRSRLDPEGERSGSLAELLSQVDFRALAALALPGARQLRIKSEIRRLAGLTNASLASTHLHLLPVSTAGVEQRDEAIEAVGRRTWAELYGLRAH